MLIYNSMNGKARIQWMVKPGPHQSYRFQWPWLIIIIIIIIIVQWLTSQSVVIPQWSDHGQSNTVSNGELVLPYCHVGNCSTLSTTKSLGKYMHCLCTCICVLYLLYFRESSEFSINYCYPLIYCHKVTGHWATHF